MMICPRCWEECWRESADIGIGIIHGPWGCPDCGWSEDATYDRANPNHQPRTDQYGGLYPEIRPMSMAQQACDQIQSEGFGAFIDSLPPESYTTVPDERFKWRIEFDDQSVLVIGIGSIVIHSHGGV